MERKRNLLSLILSYLKLPLLWFLLVIFSFSLLYREYPLVGSLDGYIGYPILIKGDIEGDINPGSEKVKVLINVVEICKSIDQEDNTKSFCNFVDAKIITWLPRYPKVVECMDVELSGKIDLPEDFENSQNFSYKEFLLSKGVGGIVYRPENYTLTKRENSLKSVLIEIRGWAVYQVASYLPEPHSSLLAGILFGVKASMPDVFELALRYTGTTHIIAASGYNVTIIANVVMSAMKGVSRKLRLTMSLVLIWCFVFISGGSIPVVRAALMLSYSIVAKILGRKSIVIISLVFSAFVLIILNPSVIKDISFQLSFVSTVGLIYLEPGLSWIFRFLPAWLKDSVTVTLAAILSTLPITLYNFGELSLVSLPVNLLVLPVVELVMMIGIVYVLIPSWLALLKQLLAVLVWIPLDYFVKTVFVFSKFKYASVEINFFTRSWIFFYYFALLIFISITSEKGRHED